jgi:polar amino acid transport system substrate-binding protein
MYRLFLAAAALVALTVGANAQTVRMGTEGAYAPFNFLDDNGKPAGFDIDVGNEVCKRAQLDCVWVTNDWDTIIPNLIAGNYDAILAGMSITDERKQSIDFTQAYMPPDPSTYMVAADSTADLAAPEGLRIGVQSNTIQASYANANLKADNTILSFDTADQALADLSAGNLDAILGDKPYVQETVAGTGGALKMAGPDIEIGNGIGIGLRKADDDLEKKFNDALDAAKADGTLDQLIVKWFPEKGEGPFFAS